MNCYFETPELTEVRRKLVADQLIGDSNRIIAEYHRLAEIVVSERSDPHDPKPQIGLIVAMAGIRHANGFILEFHEDISDASWYARNLGEHEIVAKLREISWENLNIREKRDR